jgi:hypothetical protein
VFHYLDKYAHDDTIVKLVFDHLRNYGLCALVLSVSAWKERNVGVGVEAVWDHAIVAILALVGFGLLWLNHEHLFYKLRSTQKQPANWIKFLLVVLYSIVLVEFCRYLVSGKAGA